MIERLTKNPLLLALAFLLAAVIGGGTVLLGQRLAPPAAAPGGGAAVRDYLLANPEVIPEAMQRLRDRETGKVVAANARAIVEPFGSAWIGNPRGDVTVVAYMDYGCGYCRASLPVLDQLIAKDPRVRVVFRELPILSEASRVAARWSLAAAEQGKFKPFHDALYAGGQLSEASIEAAIRTAGLDRAAAERAIGSDRVAGEIGRNLDIAQQLGANGTPTWVIGQSVLHGAVPLKDFEEAVARVRARS